MLTSAAWWFAAALSLAAGALGFIVLLTVHYYIEKDLNQRVPFFPFNLLAVLFITSFFGGTFTMVYGIIFEGVRDIGWFYVLLKAYIMPLPLLLAGYIFLFPQFRSWRRPYQAVEGTNVVKLKTRHYQKRSRYI
ncbi:hypothetical protein B0H94_11052 [Salsuginibacillus halophilus]|uniref:Uncharacterized protein n=1 Tax=Salsuginibacillus halophilus TaxID=517424 RepID=A0A2P8HBJ3_9BACI|nr:hypothetical protein [Salsuginibacillus halophilus]PSL43576.1 hypothetical protein B0H94_11052 [Salsuginibacillus halophilus]